MLSTVSEEHEIGGKIHHLWEQSSEIKYHNMLK